MSTNQQPAAQPSQGDPLEGVIEQLEVIKNDAVANLNFDRAAAIVECYRKLRTAIAHRDPIPPAATATPEPGLPLPNEAGLLRDTYDVLATANRRLRQELSAATEAKERVERERDRFKLGLSKQQDEICQILGVALGYPKYADDQKNFPGATGDDVCVGDHVAESLAEEVAAKLAAAEKELEKRTRERDEVIETFKVMNGYPDRLAQAEKQLDQYHDEITKQLGWPCAGRSPKCLNLICQNIQDLRQSLKTAATELAKAQEQVVIRGGLQGAWDYIAALIKSNSAHRTKGYRLGDADWFLQREHLKEECKELCDAATASEAREEIGDVLGVAIHMAQFQGMTPRDLSGIVIQKLEDRFEQPSLPSAASEQEQGERCLPAGIDLRAVYGGNFGVDRELGVIGQRLREFRSRCPSGGGCGVHVEWSSLVELLDILLEQEQGEFDIEPCEVQVDLPPELR